VTVANTACVVLASGLSERFGPPDKLAADLCGKSVLSRVLDIASGAGFGGIFLVSRIKAAGGISWVENKNPEAGQGHALRLGLSAAREKGWNKCAILLGDMPLVPVSHVKNLIEKSYNNQSVISFSESMRLPPAVFIAKDIDIILSQNSAFGARELFDRINPATVPLEKTAALDVDTPEDLARVVQIMEARKT